MAEQAEVLALIERGKALIAGNQHADAVPLFERATQLDPDSADAWANLGCLLETLGRSAEAIGPCDRALALDDQRLEVWKAKVTALTLVGRREEALVIVDDAVAAFEWAAALTPDDAWAWYRKGTSLGLLGVHLTVVSSIELSQAPDLNMIAPRDQKGKALLVMALDAFERALALDPSFEAAWVQKGAALSELDRQQEALDADEHALALDPNDPMAWSNKGVQLHHLGRFEEALEAYDRALVLDPQGVASLWYKKSVALRALGRATEAEAARARSEAYVLRNLGQTAEAE
jgi:tetratricopeptide (TPR) repeat protein